MAVETSVKSITSFFLKIDWILLKVTPPPPRSEVKSRAVIVRGLSIKLLYTGIYTRNTPVWLRETY